MRQVTQTLIGSGAGYPRSGEVPGNCLQAAVASLLDLDLVCVPHFGLFASWDLVLADWARQIGYDVVHHPPEALVTEAALGLSPLVVLWGNTARGPVVTHAVVGRPNGDVVWDPHPSRAGLTRIRGVIDFRPVDGS